MFTAAVLTEEAEKAKKAKECETKLKEGDELLQKLQEQLKALAKGSVDNVAIYETLNQLLQNIQSSIVTIKQDISVPTEDCKGNRTALIDIISSMYPKAKTPVIPSTKKSKTKHATKLPGQGHPFFEYYDDD